jgi:sugar phosphate isomerase/epimerase
MKLSLAGWSLQRMFRSAENPLQLLDFPAFTREHFGIDAVELNSPFFVSRDASYLDQLVKAADKVQVKLLNIAVDEDGDLSAEDEAARVQGVKNYGRWVPVAAAIGCGAIRANSGGRNITDRRKAIARCIDSFRALAEEGRRHNITILMENHGGISSDPDTMVEIIQAVRQSHGNDAAGTMPDFGNWPAEADRYESLRKIMPYAGAVHAKVMEIDEQLNHPKWDLDRCVQIARDAGYDGYLGIEYEAKAADPIEGIRRAVRKLRPLL